MSEDIKSLEGDIPQMEELNLNASSIGATVLPSIKTETKSSLSQVSDDIEKKQKLEELLGRLVTASGFEDQDDLYSDQFAVLFEAHLKHLAKADLDLQECFSILQTGEALFGGTTSPPHVECLPSNQQVTSEGQDTSCLPVGVQSQPKDPRTAESSGASQTNSEPPVATTSQDVRNSDQLKNVRTITENLSASGSSKVTLKAAGFRLTKCQKSPMLKYLPRMSFSKFLPTTEPHVAKSKFKCSCGYNSMYTSNLRTHILQFTTEWKFYCSTCKCYFFFTSTLVNHTCSGRSFKGRRASSRVRKQKLPSRGSQIAKDLASVRNSHGGRVVGRAPCGVLSRNPRHWKFPCGEVSCNQRFEYLFELKYHLAIKHKKPNTLKEFIQGCRYCGKMFRNKLEIRTHRQGFRSRRQGRISTQTSDPHSVTH